MPAIRDFSYNYTTTTNGTTIVVDVPDYRQNDLLLAVVSADTGTQTWSSTGWTAYTSQTNTSNIAILWKIATAVEPDTYTFTASVAETFNAAIISIEDTDTITPLGNFAQVNRTTAKLAFPTTTTTRDNSLLIYASNHGSTAVIASAIEGPVTQLFAKDGTAHQDHVSWGFQRSAGTTPTNVNSSVSGTTFNGKLLTIVVNPPSTGATIIPTYCDADSSIYVDPIHGTTAFNGNTAYAATATTSFGTTIATRALANATVSAQTDKGINTYRSCGGQTSSTNRTWAGARLALSASNTLTSAAGKNILCHVMPNLPIEIQTIETFSIERGIAFGMFSTANNFKIFHVHGADTPFGVNRAPVVINSAATTTLQATGTLNQNSIAGFGTFTSGFVTSADFVWTMIWVLDTTVVCGGQSGRPITLGKIVRTIAQGKERLSALQQGSNQVISYQPFQIGNGTDSTYLDASSGSFEFPSQYNIASGQINYHSVDNVAGVTFFPSANDTFDLRSCVFSSPSKFHWRWHASSNASATVLTQGLSIVGAGDVVLSQNIPITSAGFISCSTVAHNNSVITHTEFLDSLLVTSNISLVSNCSFGSSDSTVHAIELTSTGTYDLNNIEFTGYGADNTTNAAIYNNSGGSVTLNVLGGSIPTVLNGSGASTTVLASYSVNLVGLAIGSEVRAYLGTDPDTATELGGVENSTTSFSFSQSVPGQTGYIVIFHIEYQPMFLDIIYSASDQSIPIQQVTDRQYANL